MSNNSQIKILAFIIVSVFALGAVAACTDEAYADEGDFSLNEAIIKVDGVIVDENFDLSYSGEVMPLTVELDDNILVKGTDFYLKHHVYGDEDEAYTNVDVIKDAGHYKIINPSETSSVIFEIAKAEVLVSVKNQTAAYTGEGPEITYSGINVDFVDSSDIVLTIGGTEVGTYDISVQSSVDDNYELKIVGKPKFTITKAPLTDFTIEITDSEQTYNGSKLTPDVTVKDKVDSDITLSLENYIVTYTDNTDAGTATVIVEGKGNYNEIITETFTILPKNISEADVTVDPEAEPIYTGEKITPDVTVELTDFEITESDYDVDYENNTDAGIAKVKVTGKGNYTGSVTAEFTIEEAPLTDETVTVSLEDAVYDGNAKTPTITIEGLTVDVDYTVSGLDVEFINAGTYTVTVTGEGNYTGTATATFTIQAKDISSATVTVEDANLTYTGNEIKPGVTVQFEDTLFDTGNYTVSYTANTNVGDATVTVTGTGNYTGSVTKTFIITKADSTDSYNIECESDFDYTYTGKAKKPGVTFVFNGVTLEPTDYTVSYTNNINEGTAEVRITSNNFEGIYTGTFTINKAAWPEAEITVEDSVYTGSALEPEVTVKIDGVTLEPTDYTVAYESNINVGTAAKAIITLNNYIGSAEATFTIQAKDISSATVTVEDANLTYTGSEITPGVTVQFEDTLFDTGNYTVSYTANTNVGDATVTVTGKGNYTGSVTKTFIITKADLPSGEAVNVTWNTVYGADPVAKVLINGVSLEPTDYTVDKESISGNAGTSFTVEITGFDNYNITDVDDVRLTKTFDVLKATLTSDDIEITIGGSDIYDGNIKNITVKLKDGTIVSKGTEGELYYTAGSEEFKDAKEYTITVSISKGYEGNYSPVGESPDKISKTFEITKYSLDRSIITHINAFSYDGNDKIPEVSLMGMSHLVEGTDYKVYIADNTNAGTATVTVVGIGNYTGETIRTFTILAKGISSATVTVEDADLTYTGDVIEPGVTKVVIDGVTLASTDYTVSYENNTNVGTATVKVTGKGNYAGIVTKTFTITTKDLSSADVTVDLTGKTYTGDEIEPGVTKVVIDGVTLASTDYTVSYENNTNVGTATVKVTGKGNYTGSVTKTFAITKAALPEVDITVEDSVYTGSELKPEVTVKIDGVTLASTDYDVTYVNNINAGTGEVFVTFMNYSGVVTETFTIDAKILDVTVEVDEGEGLIYTGNAQKPGVVVKLDEESVLMLNTDYTVSYVNNTNVGTATVKVTGKGNYAGIVTKTFTITTKDLSSADVTVDLTGKTYTGDEIEPGVTKVVIDGVTLASTDYTVSYENNTNVGTATVKVTGKGNYAGIVTKTFTITTKDLSSADVTIDPDADLTYTGSALEPEVTVKIDGVTLEPTDYTVTYESNIDAGDATVKVTGKGNYTESVTKTFIIKSILTNHNVTVVFEEDYDFTYTGVAHTPVNAVKVDEATLAATDYTVSYENNINAGTAKVIVTFKEYAGTIEETFEITKATLDLDEDEEITVIIEEGFVYDGNAKTPGITIVTDEHMFTSNDYTVKYVNNTNAGTAKAIITFNNYNKTVVGEFTIAKASLTIVAENKTITFGDDEPDYTVKYVGFVGNDDKSVLVGDLMFTTDYDKESYDSKVVIDLSGNMTSSNYDIAYQDGTLTVNKESVESNTLLFAGVVIAIVIVIIASIAVVAVRRQ